MVLHEIFRTEALEEVAHAEAEPCPQHRTMLRMMAKLLPGTSEVAEVGSALTLAAQPGRPSSFTALQQ